MSRRSDVPSGGDADGLEIADRTARLKKAD
jgi:hypothetical protein